MSLRVTHALNGDRVLLTVEVGRESVTAIDGTTVGVTLDAEDWFEIHKRTGKARQAAERGADPEAIRRRVGRVLTQAALGTLHEGQDPVLARRRAVSSVLHHLADMVVSGTVVGLQALWPVEGDDDGSALVVKCKCRGGGHVEESISLAIIADVPA